MPMSPSATPKVLYDHVKLRGGLDLVTPTLDLSSGALRDSENFEVSTTGGYTRIFGYERFDGRARPSDATWVIVQFSAFTNTPAVTQTLTDNTTGATGQIIYVGSNYVILTKIAVATHTVGNVQKVGGTTIGTMVTQSVTFSALQQATFRGLAAEVYRALITAPTGSGPTRGVATLIVSGVDKTYAFRNNAGGTAVDVWVASTSGWTAVPLFREVTFNTGAVATPSEGEVITRGANTATVKRVLVSNNGGVFIGGTGRIIITTPSPGEFAAGAATFGTSGATANILAASTAITLAPGGKFEFVQGNFFGQSSGLRLYGVDGVNRGFEFDGTILAPITTSTTPDTPKHVAIHGNHLFFSFQSSLINSGTGIPYVFSGGGAAEIATGDEITGLLTQPGNQDGGALIIYGKQQTSILYGATSATWKMVNYNLGAGAVHYTAQNMSEGYAFDPSGVVTLRTVQDFGNFSHSTVTAPILPFIIAKRSLVANSTVSRSKSQYRLFFSDKTALYVTIVNRKYLGSAPQLFVDGVYSTSNSDGTRVNGDDDMFFGSAETTGYVMQMERGPSFDGVAIEAYFETNWNTCNSPRTLKRFRKAAIEVQGTDYVSLTFGYALGYNSQAISQPVGTVYDASSAGTAFWDSGTWDTFVWDGTSLSPTEVELKGTAESVRTRISSGTAIIYPYTINSELIHYTHRRGMR